MPTFSLPHAPANLTIHLRRLGNAPLPLILTHQDKATASAVDLSPVGFSAQDPSTSELLRTL